MFRVVSFNDIGDYVKQMEQKYHGRSYGLHIHKQPHNLLVKVGICHGGSYFTIDVNDKRNFAIISLGAAISRLKNEFLRELKVYQKLLENQSRVSNDEQIVEHFLETNEWNFYKKEFIKYEVNKVVASRGSRNRPKTAQPELGVIQATSRRKENTFIHAIDMPFFHTQTFRSQFI